MELDKQDTIQSKLEFLDKVNFNYLFDKVDIYTTRFNNNTYAEIVRYKENKNIKGTLYSTTRKFPMNASTDKYLFILEMNNDVNRIMGIGFLKNYLSKDQSLIVYKNPVYNNYIYKSMFHIQFVDHNLDWLPYIEDTSKDFIINEFEKKIFYGKSNLKRGNSFSRFPIKKMNKEHLKFLCSLFITLNPNNFNNIVSFY